MTCAPTGEPADACTHTRPQKARCQALCALHNLRRARREALRARPRCARSAPSSWGGGAATRRGAPRLTMMKPPSSAGAMLSAWKPLTAASLASPAGTSAALASGAPNSALTASAAAAALAALLPRPLPSGRPCAGRARGLGPGAPAPARCQAAGPGRRRPWLRCSQGRCAAGRHARPDTLDSRLRQACLVQGRGCRGLPRCCVSRSPLGGLGRAVVELARGYKWGLHSLLASTLTTPLPRPPPEGALRAPRQSAPCAGGCRRRSAAGQRRTASGSPEPRCRRSSPRPPATAARRRPRWPQSALRPGGPGAPAP